MSKPQKDKIPSRDPSKDRKTKTTPEVKKKTIETAKVVAKGDKEKSSKSEKPKEKDTKIKNGESHKNGDSKPKEKSKEKTKTKTKVEEPVKAPQIQPAYDDDLIEQSEVVEKPKKENTKITKNHEEKLQIDEPLVEPGDKQVPVEEDYNYEEDFEDYSDDFEDEFEEEIEAKPQVVAKRRNTAETDETEMSDDEVSVRRTNTRKPSKDNQKPDSALSTRASMGSRSTSQLSRFDFAKANKSELQLAGMSKSSKRHRELLNLIELDVANFEYFDMAPVRDYEFYIQNFGGSNRIQIQTQTGDDAEEIEVQTEELDKLNIWTQHPPTDAKGSGGDSETKTYKEESFSFDSEILNSEKLKTFVLRTGQLVCDLIMESHDNGLENSSAFKASSLSFSEQSTVLECSTFMPNSKVTCIRFSSSHPNWLVTAHSVTETEGFSHDGALCVWIVDKPTEPLHILVSNLPANTCAFSPQKPTAVYAGLPDGCLLAYDLQESAELHRRSNKTLVFRSPTYNTAFLRDSDTSCSGIVDVVTIASSRQSSGESDGYQVASLEQRGVISIWTAMVKSAAETSELDLGLRPGGKLKLVRTSTIKPSNVLYRSLSKAFDSGSKRTDTEAFAMAHSSTQLNQFFLATDTGFILHLIRDGERTGPRALQPNLEAMADVNSLQISPFEPSTLLAGLSDGTVSIYRVFFGKPVVTLQLEKIKSSVLSAKWSPGSPYKFFSLHKSGQFLSWDLKHNPVAPVQIEELNNCTSFDIFQTASDDTAEKAKVFLSFAFNDGSVQVHKLKSKDRYTAADGPKLLKILEAY